MIKLKQLLMRVLILVLVDHTLGEVRGCTNTASYTVLILVLVDHTLGAEAAGDKKITGFVLILVLVDHTLGAPLRLIKECNLLS